MYVPLEYFSVIWRSHLYWWLQSNFDLYSALVTIAQWGFFSMPLLYCDTGHPFIMVVSKDPWYSHLLLGFCSGAVTTSVAPGYRTPPTLRMRGKCFNRLRHMLSRVQWPNYVSYDIRVRCVLYASIKLNRFIFESVKWIRKYLISFLCFNKALKIQNWAWVTWLLEKLNSVSEVSSWMLLGFLFTFLFILSQANNIQKSYCLCLQQSSAKNI